jgi:hypothetical protein
MCDFEWIKVRTNGEMGGIISIAGRHHANHTSKSSGISSGLILVLLYFLLPLIKRPEGYKS